MNRNSLTNTVNAGLVIMFFITFVTGILKFPGLLPMLGIGYDNLPLNVINACHYFGGLLFGLLVLVHLFLHLRKTKNKKF